MRLVTGPTKISNGPGFRLGPFNRLCKAQALI
jgi:hypothetical protein